jgi:hypothetical protein
MSDGLLRSLDSTAFLSQGHDHQKSHRNVPILYREVEEEAEAIVVRSQGLPPLALPVFALKELKLGELLVHSVCDFRPSHDPSFHP